MKELASKIFGTVAMGILTLYGFSVLIMAPYYNWQYARNNGVIDWILFGEILATAKAVVWPYFVLFDNPRAGKIDASVNGYPDLTTEETAVLSKITAKAMAEELTESDINDLKNAYKSYEIRTGSKIPKSDIDKMMKVMELMLNYNEELNKSALISWDRNSVYMTDDFQTALKIVEFNELRKPALVKSDITVLGAAAEHRNYFEDIKGDKFELSRESILNNLHTIDVSRSNFKKMQSAMHEYAQ